MSMSMDKKTRSRTTDAENIYTFNKEDINPSISRVLLNPDVVYRTEPPSNRHRGLTPMMISILSIIYKTSRIAEKRGKKFIGLTMHACQKSFNACGISNDTIRDNIRKLWTQMRFVKRTILASSTGKVNKDDVAYYNINDERFPCKDGTFFMGEEGFGSGNRLWAFHCPEYPFCSGMAKDCIIDNDLKSLRDMLTDSFFAKLTDRIKNWSRSQEEISEMSQNLPDLLRKDTDEFDYFGDFLFDKEKSSFVEKLIIARKKGILKEKIEEIRNEIISMYNRKKDDSDLDGVGKDDVKNTLDCIP
jgi:hypothetical protein